jgi:hypothetical protein
MVNIINNSTWNDGVNYALNVTGYSMFGGVQINGEDPKYNIYKRIGDLSISTASLSSIIFKTNYGFWEAMRLNTGGVSINTSLYVSGTTTINNTITCTSSLNVSGITTLNNNVGIGITNPNCRLYISSNLTASATVYAMRISSGASTDGGGFGTLIGLGSEPNGWSKCAIGHTRTGPFDQGDIVFLTRATGDSTSCTMSDEKMRINKFGYVGIGTNNPTSIFQIGSGGRLRISNNDESFSLIGTKDLADTTSTRIILRGANSFTSPGAVQYYVGGTNGSHIYYTNNSERMRIKNNGFVGIGSIDPQALLQVAPGGTSTGSITQRYFSVGFNLTTTIDPTANVCAIFDSSIWCKDRVTTSSDERIKKNIQDIDDDVVLQKILQIQPKTYEYINKVERGGDVVFGFIAQQIKEVIPEAVKIEKAIIPNIYKLCNYNDDIISIPDGVIEKLMVNDEIEVITKDNIRNIYKIIEIDNNYVKINEKLDSVNHECFVIGTKVDDFHTLNKDYIFTLNVCATQELYKLIQQQNILIQDLKKRIEILENLN